MLRNFFTVAVRNFMRQRLYSVINVLGLTSGLVCTLFIALWVRDEVAKDQFHDHVDRIYSIVANLNQGDNGIVTWGTPGPLGDAIREQVPEAELVARTQDEGPQLFQVDDKMFLEKGLYADPDFFKIFNYTFVAGTHVQKERDKSWICVSDVLARKLFGNVNVIGKQIKVGRKWDVLVTGVFEGNPSNSSLKFDYILPFEIYREIRGQGFEWGNFDHPLYVRLREGVSGKDAMSAINTRTKSSNPLKDVEFYLQPFSEQYLHSNFENGRPVGGRIQFVQIFSIVAVFILAIACINFMNMATARAASRAKEVGVRKVAGAERSSLVAQFLSESLLISTLSAIIALVIVAALLPIFNQLVNKQIVLPLTNPVFALAIVGCIAVTGILAGSYPAFYLSSFRPAGILKGALVVEQGRIPLRKLLVIFQFSLTVILVAGALVVFRQTEFIRTTNVGYDRQGVLSFKTTRAIYQDFESFRNEASKIKGVSLVSRANETLVQVNNQNSSVSWSGKSPESKVMFRTVVVDYDFLETLGLQKTEGRFFTRTFNDTSNFVITQRAAELMGLSNPVGHKITQWGISGNIVGVSSDFHSRSLHEAIDPVVFMCNPAWANTVFVRFDVGATQATVTSMQELFKKFSPGYPFEYSFLDDDFERLYDTEKVTGSLALGFTVMAIIISSLGLLGLAAYTTERKRKEISIRKTLGASVSGLVLKIAREFLVLSFVAILIGCPIAGYMMNKFLQGYAYHIDLGWKIFAITACATILVTILTVIFQVARAAVANPVDALRNE